MTEQHLEQLMTTYAQQIRGKILQRVIEIERMIDYYISSHFTSNDDLIEELLGLIVCPLSFRTKQQVFQMLLNKHNPQFVEANKLTLTKLESIIKNRNMIAHWAVDFSQNAKKDFVEKELITFVSIKGKEIALQTEEEKALKRKATSWELRLGEWHTFSESQINNDIVKPMIAFESMLKDLLGWQPPPKEENA
jgi:hypothetical protein